ncbi:Acyl transferase [Trinorchestia longiramus]|nr:Acyl transferase [Trinorchestia longiramus]
MSNNTETTSYHHPDAVGSLERNLQFQLMASSMAQDEDLKPPSFPAPSPKSRTILLFPNQGSQYVGMGRELLDFPQVKEMYSVASEILGYDVLEVSTNGPKELLDKPEVAHPAIMVASLAAVQKLIYNDPLCVRNCSTAAGYGLGELTALAFAGAFSFEDAVRVCKFRAAALSAVCEGSNGGLASLTYGADCRVKLCCIAAQTFCEKQNLPHAHCSIVGHHWSNSCVVAGSEEALDFLEKHKEELKLQNVRRHHNVEGPLHTPLMKPAAAALEKFLQTVSIREPVVPVISSADVKYYTLQGHVLKKLPLQLCSPIKWLQLLAKLYDRRSGVEFPLTFVCGPVSSNVRNNLPNYLKLAVTMYTLTAERNDKLQRSTMKNTKQQTHRYVGHHLNERLEWAQKAGWCYTLSITSSTRTQKKI